MKKSDCIKSEEYAHQAAKDIWPDQSVLFEDLEALKFMAWQQLRKGAKSKAIPTIIADEYREILKKSNARS